MQVTNRTNHPDVDVQLKYGKFRNSMDSVVRVVYATIEELNTQLPKDNQIEQALTAHLIGENGRLDSLALANFIVIAEQKLREFFGLSVNLTQDDPFSPETGHFHTVGRLCQYIFLLVQQRSSEQGCSNERKSESNP